MKTTIKDFGNGIYAIDQEMVRAFLILGEKRAILLDTGAEQIDIWSYIKEITTLPVTVVLTHGDGDHIANLDAFSEVFLCEREIDLVQRQMECKDIQLHTLADGEKMELGGRTVTIVYSPGHSNGSICLLDEADKILFSGDTVSYGPVFMFGEHRNMDLYLQSLKKLCKMRDEGIFHTVYCCHNSCPVSGEIIDDLMSCVKGIQDSTIELTPAQLPLPTTDPILIARKGNCGILVAK